MVCKFNNQERFESTMAVGISEGEMNSQRRMTRAISVDSSLLRPPHKRRLSRAVSMGRGKAKSAHRDASVQTDHQTTDRATNTETIPIVSASHTRRCTRTHSRRATIGNADSSSTSHQVAVKMSGLLLRAMGDSLHATVDLHNPQQPIIVVNIN